MTFNPRAVPWAIILALPGALVGYLIGGAQWPQAQGATMVGLVVGCSAGMLVHLLVRVRAIFPSRRDDPDA
jgi:hypothetical protein